MTKQLTTGQPKGSLLAIDGRKKSPQLTDPINRDNARGILEILKDDFDVGLDSKAIDDLTKPPVEPPSSTELRTRKVLLEQTVIDGSSKNVSVVDVLAAQEELKHIDERIVAAEKREEEARNSVEDSWGSSLKTLGHLAGNVSDAAVGLFLRGEGKEYAALLDGETEVGVSPSADKRKAKALYAAVDRLNGERKLSNLADPKATQSLVGALLGASVRLGTPTATEKLVALSDDPVAAKRIVLDESDTAIATGDVNSIRNINSVVGPDALKARHPDLGAKVVSNYVPDPEINEAENAGFLVGLMNDLGIDWTSVDTYRNANGDAKRMFSNSAVEGYVERQVQNTVYDQYG